MLRYWVGWGGVGIIPSLSLATLHDLGSMLNLLRYLTFTCTWCYVTGWGGVGLGGVGWGGVGWGGVGIIARLSLASLHDHGSMLSLLRYVTFTCTWCYVAGWGGVGTIPSLSLASLHDLVSMLNLLRYLTFTCTWCYVAGWGGAGIIPSLSLATQVVDRWWQSLDKFYPADSKTKIGQTVVWIRIWFGTCTPFNVDLKNQLASLRWKRNCARPQKKVWKHKMLQFADKNSIFGKMTAG